MSRNAVEVQVGERTLALSNLDKVLWPETGTTKGEMLDYYVRAAPVLLPHLAGRPITLRRFPNGIDKASFFEKNCPSHRPDWLPTTAMGDVSYCLLQEPAALAWVANLASIELHPTLASAPDLQCPRSVVFDLDPGPPADVLTCARVAQMVRDMVERLGMKCWIKTSGSKGLQLYVPLNSVVSYSRTSAFAKAVALLLERSYPELVVSSQQRAIRAGKVLVDWGQNAASKTTVAAYSVRARPRPTVSTPLTWDEVDDALSAGRAELLVFDIERVLERMADSGDLMAEVLTCVQDLPELDGAIEP